MHLNLMEKQEGGAGGGGGASGNNSYGKGEKELMAILK